MFCWDSDIETRPLVPRLGAVFTEGTMLINYPQMRFRRPLASSLSQLHSSARFYWRAPSGVSCDSIISGTEDNERGCLLIFSEIHKHHSKLPSFFFGSLYQASQELNHSWAAPNSQCRLPALYFPVGGEATNCISFQLQHDILAGRNSGPEVQQNFLPPPPHFSLAL